MIILGILLLSFSLQAMESDPLLKHQAHLIPVAPTTQSQLQALPKDVAYQILGFLVEGDKEGAQGFFSLAKTCRANNQLCRDFGNLQVNQEKTKELKINYLKINDENAVQFLKVAHELRKKDKIKECTSFMAQGIEPSCNDCLYDFFASACVKFTDKNNAEQRLFLNSRNAFEQHIKEKYGISDYTLDISETKDFKVYKKQRENVQRCLFAIFFCPCAFTDSCC